MNFFYSRPIQQLSKTEVFQSIERPYMSAVFGTSIQPSGLSGVLRRGAFRFSESKLQHWFLLVLADRINVVEGFVQDLRKGHIPNISKEKGLPARWKHDRKKLCKELLLKTIVAGLVIGWIRKRK
jgi:hypothetical protein